MKIQLIILSGIVIANLGLVACGNQKTSELNTPNTKVQITQADLDNQKSPIQIQEEEIRKESIAKASFRVRDNIAKIDSMLKSGSFEPQGKSHKRLLELKTDLGKLHQKLDDGKTSLDKYFEFSEEVIAFYQYLADFKPEQAKAKVCIKISSNSSGRNNILTPEQQQYLLQYMQLELDTAIAMEDLIYQKYQFYRTVYFGKLSSDVVLDQSQQKIIDNINFGISSNRKALRNKEEEISVINTDCKCKSIPASFYDDVREK